MPKRGRNEPCLCGSGKKFKRCCMPELKVPIGEDMFVMDRLFKEMAVFCRDELKGGTEEADLIFWEDEIPEDFLNEELLEFSFANYFDWMVSDWIVDNENGETVIDIFREQTRKFNDLELEILDRIRQSVLSLFEVHEIIPGKALVLEDQFFGDKYEIEERNSAEFLTKGDIFAARILKMDGEFTLSGAIYPYPSSDKEKILAAIQDRFIDYKNDFPDPDFTLRNFLKEAGHLFNSFWVESILISKLSDLADINGEPILFSKAVFDVIDENLVIQRLKAAKKLFFEEDPGTFVWTKNAKRGESAPLGLITVTQGGLTLDCISKERLEEGKSLIATHVGSAAAHKADSFLDPLKLELD